MRRILSSQIFSATFWQLLGKGVTATGTFVTVLLLGKFLGEAGFGDFSKIFALVETFYIFADFGLNATFIKKVKGGGQEGYLFGQLLTLRLINAVLLILLVLFVALLFPFNSLTGSGFSPAVKLATIPAPIIILDYSIFLTSQAAFQLHLNFFRQFLAQTIGSLAKIALVITIVLIKPGLFAVIIAIVAAETLMSGTSLALCKFYLGKLSLRFNFDRARELITQSAPIGLSLIFNLFYFRGDILILSAFRSSAEVGNYSLAYKFFETSLVLPIFLVNALYPLMVESFSKGLGELKRSVAQYSGILFALSIAGFLGLFFIAPAFVGIIFGRDFILSAAILRILSVGLPFFYLSALYMWLLVTLGAQKFLLPVYGVGAAINLLANYFLIPAGGALAAAIITVVSEGVILLTLYLIYRYYLKRLNDIKNL